MSIAEVNLVITVLLALVAFFGGMVIMGLSRAVDSLREADKELAREIGDRVKAEDLRELRQEMRQSFAGVFSRLDDLRAQVGDKVSRDECAGNMDRLRDRAGGVKPQS